MNLQRILVPVDFTESMARTLQYATAFAREFAASITLLHVVKADRSCIAPGIRVSQLVEAMREARECQLTQLIDVLCEDEIEMEAVVATGKPDPQIVNEAKEMKADLIIMGSRGPVGAWGLFRRNTTSKVVRYAPCPVLVVPLFDRGFLVDKPTLRSLDI